MEAHANGVCMILSSNVDWLDDEKIEKIKSYWREKIPKSFKRLKIFTVKRWTWKDRKDKKNDEKQKLKDIDSKMIR